MNQYLILKAVPGRKCRDPHVDHKRYLGYVGEEPAPMAYAMHAVLYKALRRGEVVQLNEGTILAESAADALRIWSEANP